VNALIFCPAGKTSGIPAKKCQTDDDVVLDGLSLIGLSAQVKKKTITRNYTDLRTESFRFQSKFILKCAKKCPNVVVVNVLSYT